MTFEDGGLNEPMAVPTAEVKKKIERPLGEKIEESLEIIDRTMSICRYPCVAFSGGKDSTVVIHLVRLRRPDIPILFQNTRCEHKLTYEFVRKLKEEWNLNLHEVKAKKTFWDICKECGVPVWTADVCRIGLCCHWLKKEPASRFFIENSIDGTITGRTAIESRVRMFAAMRKGALYKSEGKFSKKVLYESHPILWWTPKDVWDYTKANNLPFNQLYHIVDRVGCVLCCAHKGWEEQVPKLATAGQLKILYKYLGKEPITSYCDIRKESVDGRLE
uniref:Putative phosphoadenosine phosphosulfate n=1 Tax=viral metagenome TaxID=1070528 RepID=A0A6H1ZPZ3_9ZZZZ